MKRFDFRIITYPSVIILYYLIMNVFGITCPLKAIFGWICPTCGMTRAMICFFKLDMQGYFSHNAMALPIAVTIILLMFRNYLKCKRVVLIVGIGILLLNLLYYIMRLYIGVK